MKILFVCTGNTCRSPMAEAILRHVNKDVEVQSAGIFAANGGQANPYTVEVLQTNGIGCVHDSQPVTNAIMQWADVVLTMTVSHQAHLKMEYPQYIDKIHALLTYVTDEHTNVMDPYGGTLIDYEETYDHLFAAIKRLNDKINQEKGENSSNI